MTTIDWVIVAFTLLLMPLGLRQGFIVGALSLGGFAGGAFVGSRVGPLVLAGGSESAYAPLAALLGGLLVGGLLSTMLEGAGVAIRRTVVRGEALRKLDAAGGAAVLALLALAISWVLGAVALNTPALKQYRDDVQRSAILSALNETFPPSGPILNVLNRIDPTPALVGPSADVQPPPDGVSSDPEIEAAAGSVVRVLGSACGLNLNGSGWVAAPETVVTNAHVVAGVDSPTVEAADGSSFGAGAMLYRPRDDIAILRVPGLGLGPIPLAGDPQSGDPGAVAGYPGGGELRLTGARLGTTGTVRSQDSYGRGPIEREMTSFRARVEGGNSGGPVIGTDGEVLATVFATAVGSERPEGLGVPSSVVGRLLGRAGGSADTGPCA